MTQIPSLISLKYALSLNSNFTVRGSYIVFEKKNEPDMYIILKSVKTKVRN